MSVRLMILFELNEHLNDVKGYLKLLEQLRKRFNRMHTKYSDLIKKSTDESAIVIHVKKRINLENHLKKYKECINICNKLSTNIESRIKLVNYIYKFPMKIEYELYFEQIDKPVLLQLIEIFNGKKKRLNDELTKLDVNDNTYEIIQSFNNFRILKIEKYIKVCKKYLTLLDRKVKLDTYIITNRIQFPPLQ